MDRSNINFGSKPKDSQQKRKDKERGHLLIPTPSFSFHLPQTTCRTLHLINPTCSFGLRFFFLNNFGLRN